MKYCADKDTNKLISALIREGWRYERRRKHGSLVTPDSAHTIFLSITPSDWQSINQLRRDIRRYRGGSSLSKA